MRKQLAVFLAIILVGTLGFLSLPIGGVTITTSNGFLSVSTNVALAVNTLPLEIPTPQSFSPGEIETLRPNAAGDECSIPAEVGVACPNHWQNVNETPSDNATSYVGNPVAAYYRDFYNITDSTGSGTISNVTVYARAYGQLAVSLASLNITIKSGTGSGAPDTINGSTIQTVTTVWANYTAVWATNPATFSAWTWDEIDQLQIGVAIRQCHTIGAATRVTQVYAKVNYEVGVTPTVTNGVNATNIATTGARLNGNLTADGGENCTVNIYWGASDGVTNSSAWTNNETIGTQASGTFYKDIANLTLNMTYFYRCYANNSAGDDWADSTANFTTLEVAIINTPDSYDFETVLASSTYSTGLTAFNVTNTGDVPVNISISGTNMTSNIGVGSEAKVRAFRTSGTTTYINKDNPANGDGTITSVEIYAQTSLTGCKVGIFHTTGTDKLKCRSAVTIGNVPAGSKQTFSVSLAVLAGDYIGIYWSGGWGIYYDTPGYQGIWLHEADHCVVDDEATYGLFGSVSTISLYGIETFGWTLNDTATPGADQFGLKAGLNGTDYNILVALNAPYNNLCTNLAVNATQGWGLELYAPTSYSDGYAKSGVVTLTATEA